MIRTLEHKLQTAVDVRDFLLSQRKEHDSAYIDYDDDEEQMIYVLSTFILDATYRVQRKKKPDYALYDHIRNAHTIACISLEQLFEEYGEHLATWTYANDEPKNGIELVAFALNDAILHFSEALTSFMPYIQPAHEHATAPLPKETR